jgi:anti-sigma factor RsiW
MTCLELELVDLYIERELPDEQRREVEAHLAACPTCREAAEERRALLGAFSSLPPVELPPGFAASVLARLPEDAEEAASGIRLFAAGLSVFLAGLLGYFLVSGRSLVGVLLAMGRSLIDAVSLVVPLLAKGARLGGVVLKLAGGILRLPLQAFEIAASILSPEILGLLLAGGLVLSCLILLGMRRILSPGEKT